MVATVLKKKQTGAYNHFVIQAPAIAGKAKPGQFVEIRVTGDQAPFWRRPFSICRAYDDKIELLIKEIGSGTALLARLSAGARLEMLGPLGRGFALRRNKKCILVGGGFGVAPLMFLAERLRQQACAVEVFVGGRCEDDLLLRREIKKLGATLECTTEDGSYGAQGYVTAILEQRLQQLKEPVTLAASGPLPMLQAVTALAKKYKLPVEVSLEEVMACGLGVCNGCVIQTIGGYLRVCKDGPVFDGYEVLWS